MKTKKQLKLFTIFEYEKEQDYLRRMHGEGWRLVKVSGLGVYHFEQCTPQDVVYQLDYNPQGLENKEEYLKMFDDCGWEYLQDYFGYSYFRKAVGENGVREEIFCDDESRLQMMQRVLRGRLLPLLIIFFCILLPQLLNALGSHNYFAAALAGGALAVYVAIFLVMLLKYAEYKNGTGR